MNPRETLEAFDRYLESRALRLTAVVIGGTALNLLGVITRATKDCDILDPPLPPRIAEAARGFAGEARQHGVMLQDDWLNNGPASLTSVLPPGWRERLQLVFTGSAIELRCLGREDLLRSKLFALCDRGFDLGDCLALCAASRGAACDLAVARTAGWQSRLAGPRPDNRRRPGSEAWPWCLVAR
ncbi:MAG TPA: DUF6036 family nucleotidyltransferase [Kofleriaceae bacterium]|nr:DUF6036 family nucleotidyltransferase [Kofleriaceae bacterium]